MQCAFAILSSVVCLAVRYFSTLPHKRYDFRIKKFDIKCVFLFSSKFFSEKALTLGIKRYICIGLHVKYQLFLSDFYGT